MRNSLQLCLLFSVGLSACGTLKPEVSPAPPKGVLVFTRTAGYRHDSIPTAVACLDELAGELGLQATNTEDPGAFTDANLARFAAVVFLSTTMDVLAAPEEAAFERYIRRGGGYLGVHAATDTEYDWAWYTGLVGAQFASHPKIQSAELLRTSAQFPATSFLPERWQRSDEWYNFKSISPHINVLLLLDEESYEGGTNGALHPAAWYHEYDGGRAFYTAGGHTEASYAEPLFREHLKAGLRWAAGLPDPQ